MAGVIAVSGVHSGVGKTAVACKLLGAVAAPVAALKVTVVDSGQMDCPIHRPCMVCSSLRQPFQLVHDRRALDLPNKDTGRYFAAGAARVVWVKTHGEHLLAAVQSGLERLSGWRIIAEGNTAVEVLSPDWMIMVDRQGPRRETKASASRVFKHADLGVANVPGWRGWTEVGNEPTGIRPADRAPSLRLSRDLPGRPVVTVDVAQAPPSVWRELVQRYMPVLTTSPC